MNFLGLCCIKDGKKILSDNKNVKSTKKKYLLHVQFISCYALEREKFWRVQTNENKKNKCKGSMYVKRESFGEKRAQGHRITFFRRTQIYVAWVQCNVLTIAISKHLKKIDYEKWINFLIKIPAIIYLIHLK